jgi:hypothetical protein
LGGFVDVIDVQKPIRFDSFSFMTAGGRYLGMDVDVDIERM